MIFEHNPNAAEICYNFMTKCLLTLKKNDESSIFINVKKTGKIRCHLGQ